ncbi:hypothetical protein HOLleu_43449 [Holothuria leucospilota]|uniref:Uncharacterized protein n=1 Tax=Holothuria leucospilota TaxID=206669 RepID=A0A9Q0YAP4_HOLLE|nr:hypothetical protein HOLleu_43449 [Holothuria leucospilota]
MDIFLGRSRNIKLYWPAICDIGDGMTLYPFSLFYAGLCWWYSKKIQFRFGTLAGLFVNESHDGNSRLKCVSRSFRAPTFSRSDSFRCSLTPFNLFFAPVIADAARFVTLLPADIPRVFAARRKEVPWRTSPAISTPVQRASFPSALAPLLKSCIAERNNPPSIFPNPWPV